MQEWYHSGFEGYCKAAARMMGLPNDNSGWGNFGRDLFKGGRFDDPAKASKTWTLSRFRSQGRSNRPKLFEESWLGRNGRDSELEAIHTCAHALCGNGNTSALYELYHYSGEAFASGFRDEVLPAIKDGFFTERYQPSDIERFSLSIAQSLEELRPSLPQTFRRFAVMLVAGIIYGPDHAAAQAKPDSITFRSASVEGDEALELSVEERRIILTQTFSNDLSLIGYSESISDDNVVLLGRGADSPSLDEMANLEIAQAVRSKNAIAFPIAATHKLVSKAHGLLVPIGHTWYYHDYSSNGSYIENGGRVSTLHGGTVALVPGDTLVLGLLEPSESERVTYCEAAAIHVSFNVEN